MGERELRAKYGGKLDKAINRAIRAEIPEGNAALDLLTKLSGPAFHSGAIDSSGNPTDEAIAFEKHQKTVVNPMIARIRQAYSIPPEKAKAKSSKPSKTRRTGPTGTAGPRGKPKSPAKRPPR